MGRQARAKRQRTAQGSRSALPSGCQAPVALALRTPRPAGVFCHMRSPWAPARLGSRGSSTRRARRLNEQRPHWFPGAAGSGWEAELRPCCSVQPASSLCNQQVLCAAAATPWGGGREGHLRGWRGGGSCSRCCPSQPRAGAPPSLGAPAEQEEGETNKEAPPPGPPAPPLHLQSRPGAEESKGEPSRLQRHEVA